MSSKNLDLVEAILGIAETGEIGAATEAMAAGIDGCVGLHCTFLTQQGARKQIAYARTPKAVGERLKTDFQTAEDNPMIAGMFRLPINRLVPVERYVDMDAYLNSQLFQEMIEPYNTPFISTIMLPGRHGLVTFGLGQRDGANEVTFRAGESMAFQVARAMDLYAGSQSPNRDAFLVDGAGYLAGTSEISIRRMTGGALHLSRKGGQVVPVETASRQGFGRCLRRVTDSGTAAKMICLDELGQPRTVTMAPGPKSVVEQTVWITVEKNQRLDWSAGDLTAVHRLTRREASVVLALLDGHNAQTASLELGLSDRSVRTYLSNIYNKLGVSTQTDLVRMLLGPLAD